jgi:hypothetical protein
VHSRLLCHDIRFRNRDRRGARVESQPVIVTLLRARPYLGDETRRSLVGHTAQIGVGLRLADRCFELQELRLRLDKLLIPGEEQNAVLARAVIGGVAVGNSKMPTPAPGKARMTASGSRKL